VVLSVSSAKRGTSSDDVRLSQGGLSEGLRRDALQCVQQTDLPTVIGVEWRHAPDRVQRGRATGVLARPIGKHGPGT